MNRTITFCLASLAFTAVSLAQEAVPGATVKNGGISPQHLGMETVVGCLSRMQDGSYTVLGGKNSGKQFRIVSGDVSGLNHADGQDVEVFGLVGQNDAASNQNGIYNEGSTTGVGYLTIKAERVKVLGANCSLAGQEWEGDHRNMKK